MDTPFYGFYRAKVVNNKDPDKFGRVLLWIPDLMPQVSDDEGLWARPANNPIGGRNNEEDSEHHYMGTSYIPKIGSWLWVFFENGNPNRPYYWGALDLENTKVLPENQLGSNYEDKWTVFKSHDGRCIVVSDDPDDKRIEITGRKMNLSSPPTGDTSSVYTIDGNQTTILLDERDGKEKVLIRTHKGDFLHIDVDEQKLQAFFESDIHIKTNSKLYITSEDEMHLSTNKKLFVYSKEDMEHKTDAKIHTEAKDEIHLKSTTSHIFNQAAQNVHLKAGGDVLKEAVGKISNKNLKSYHIDSTDSINILSAADVNIDGSTLNEQGGASQPGDPATDSNTAIQATEATPEGNRDT